MVKKQRNFEYFTEKLIAFTKPSSMVADQFRILRTNINLANSNRSIRSLVITSASHSEGKSTTTANLAIVFAQEGKKMLLVDADMRKPTLHSIFQVGNTRGLSTLLAEQNTLESSLISTEIDGLDLLTSGPVPTNPTELLSSKAFEEFMKRMEELYELVIFDSPPLLSIADGQILANKCKGVILVVNSGKTEKEKALKAKEALSTSSGKLLGAILNNFNTPKYAQDYKKYMKAESG